MREIKWRGRPPTLTPEQAARARAIIEMRRSMPTLSDLARELGVSQSTVEKHAYQPRKRYAAR